MPTTFDLFFTGVVSFIVSLIYSKILAYVSDKSNLNKWAKRGIALFMFFFWASISILAIRKSGSMHFAAWAAMLGVGLTVASTAFWLGRKNKAG